MNKLIVGVFAGLMACVYASTANAQASDTPFQVNFATDLLSTPTLITVSNTGASSTVASPVQNGALCANTYAFSTSGPLLACCSCKVAANNLRQMSVRNDVLQSANKAPPDSVVLKIMASTGAAGACNAATVTTGADVLATGLGAWSRKGSASFNNGVHFTASTLSAAELTAIKTQCALLEPSGRACGSCP